MLGKAALLNLGDCLCGVFVASETEDIFLVKLTSEPHGWMALCEQDQTSGRLYIRYDTVTDPRIIKIDTGLFDLLSKHLGQSPDSYRDIAFCYKAPLPGKDIFRENGITASTRFNKNLYKKFTASAPGNLALTSSSLSITGSVTTDTLKNFENIGFLLVKDSNSLVSLVKNMLEDNSAWGTQATVAQTKGYINCPASLVGDELKAHALDLDLNSSDKDSSLLLEAYASVYCYLNYGTYYRLIDLNNLSSSIIKDKELCYQPIYYTTPTTPPVVPSKESVLEEVTKSKDQTVGDVLATTFNSAVNNISESSTRSIPDVREVSTQTPENKPLTSLPPLPPPMPILNTNGAIPPPPPPPPIPNAFNPVLANAQSICLDQITAIKLKTVEPNSNASVQQDYPNELMSQLDAAVKFKEVETNNNVPLQQDYRSQFIAQIQQSGPNILKKVKLSEQDIISLLGGPADQDEHKKIMNDVLTFLDHPTRYSFEVKQVALRRFFKEPEGVYSKNKKVDVLKSFFMQNSSDITRYLPEILGNMINEFKDISELPDHQNMVNSIKDKVTSIQRFLAMTPTSNSSDITDSENNDEDDDSWKA